MMDAREERGEQSGRHEKCLLAYSVEICTQNRDVWPTSSCKSLMMEKISSSTAIDQAKAVSFFIDFEKILGIRELLINIATHNPNHFHGSLSGSSTKVADLVIQAQSPIRERLQQFWQIAATDNRTTSFQKLQSDFQLQEVLNKIRSFVCSAVKRPFSYFVQSITTFHNSVSAPWRNGTD
ncbi:hypothetical protein CDAR_417101 [Caerostris darwini]|uniref:Uncharacterized protein n=1 Tax=Caerostris darwini TaxID=1538125 RepID=A0AAV4X976_9ARAC|nr:hypothetical protein CDAR_417101 [Caerostris darwini]